jgi:hypothetical protein
MHFRQTIFIELVFTHFFSILDEKHVSLGNGRVSRVIGRGSRVIGRGS